MDNRNASWLPDELLEVAKWQKYMIWLILLQLLSLGLLLASAAASNQSPSAEAAGGILALFVLVARVVIFVLSLYGVYKMAKSLRKGTAILYAIGMIIPLIGLIILISLSAEATKLLQNAGVRVGLMGANADDLDRIKNRPTNDITTSV